MKILFIYEYNHFEPLGMMSLSAYLKKHGYECYFIDIKLEKDYIREIEKIKPDIIAYTVLTGKHKFWRKINLKLKEKLKFFALFGGPHCTFFPEFIYENGVDAVCRGEGEQPFLKLVRCLENKEDITTIRSLWVKKNGIVFKNEVENLIENLDELPFMDRELINKYNHYKKVHRRYVLSGRGCPFRCTYCFNHSFNKLFQGKGRIIRKRSVGNVIGELKEIKEKCKPTKFQFLDDTFALDCNWVMEFCKRYKKEIGLPFIVQFRTNFVKDEVIKAVKDAGCIAIMLGIECGNERLRNEVLKRDTTDSQIIEAAKVLQKYKMPIFAMNMVGLPDETLDDVFTTIRINVICKPSYAWASIFQPYPRTELWEYSKQKGYFDGDIDSVPESYYDTSIIKIKDIKKIVRLHKFFSLCVAFPFIIPIIKQLIKLPLNKLYTLIWNLHRAWCYIFEVSWVDFTDLLIRE